MTMEPFGYFRAEPFGWADCAESDEGAQPLYDLAAINSLSADIATLEQEHRSMRARNERLEARVKELEGALLETATMLNRLGCQANAAYAALAKEKP